MRCTGGVRRERRRDMDRKIPKTMRAVVLEAPCAPEDLHVSEVAVPKVKPGWVLVRVRAFGLNRSELMLRAEEVAESYIKHPVIPGIECAGVVADGGDTRFCAGERVVALMGGMGRSFDGSYAEYALLPASHVFSIEGTVPPSMDWAEIAAVPETWFTAWGSLFVNLRVKAGQWLLIRGGTSALGIAALQMAKACGCTVASTSRKPKRLEALREIGADAALLDDGALRDRAREVRPEGFDGILELVGPRTLEDSMGMAADGSQVCMTGILAKPYVLDDFDPIKDIPNGVSLSGFYSNYPTQEAMDAIFGLIAAHGLHPHIAARYSLDEIGRAHRDMESSALMGKAVVVLS